MDDYETGYRNGGSSCMADWTCALDEYCTLPADVDPESPTAVARYIARLQRSVPDVGTLPPPPRYDPLPDPVVPDT